MRLPRSLSGAELGVLLGRRYGYVLTRQRGSHLRLTSNHRGYQHRVTVPRHNPLRVGTLSEILNDVASYLGTSRDDLARELFGDI